MSKREILKVKINSLHNGDKCIQEYHLPEIFIAEMERDGTAYVLSEIDKIKKTCKIADVEVELNEERVFIIGSSSNIVFIPIDGRNGLLKGDSNCDFIFFNELDFCFVEMKLNATLTTEQTILQQTRAVRQNRKKALRQLKKTIDYFNSQLLDNYEGLSLEAYVATPDIYPRENAAFQDIATDFLEETKVVLFERREKRYD